MALGSSAVRCRLRWGRCSVHGVVQPEILLSVIEVMSNDFYSGSLGPSTIVGSAAFNLFIILAVCVMCIPEGKCSLLARYRLTIRSFTGDLRTIYDFKVFLITGIASVLAPHCWPLTEPGCVCCGRSR